MSINKKFVDYHDNIYDLLSEYSDKRLKNAIKGKVYVRYSNFETDKEGIPINNIDNLAVRGTVKMYQKHDPFWGKGSDYESKSIKNPTWLDIAKMANDMIKTTGDKQHVFFEGIKKRNNKYYFIMGS